MEGSSNMSWWFVKHYWTETRRKDNIMRDANKSDEEAMNVGI